MGLTDVLVQSSDMVSISVKVFVGGGVLQHAGDGAQDVTLLRLQGGAGGPLHHIETVWSHDSRVHVAIVDQVTDNLRAVTQTGSDITALIWFKTKVFLFFLMTLIPSQLQFRVGSARYCLNWLCSVCFTY